MTVKRSGHSSEPYFLGKDFEKIVGKKLDQFRTPAEMEEAIEKKLGRKLKSVSVDPEQIRKQSEKIIKESYLLLNNL
ncbi:hypothetical protein SAMN05216404_11519 [Nitrosospira multiformis]|uniref:Uncharacterized protein n=1 Tax=Nitrosospira multiformis TaxID=1231 RepID=A0A1H8N4J9_9PROT|nr:hypothetical protein [Nitrosospira multiformis]SEO24446.1 hypothetical protein SAMN05216404_11519 [Nitrosospira multiformis]